MTEPHDPPGRSDDGWMPLPDVSRGPTGSLPPPAPPLHIEPGPAWPTPAAPPRPRRRFVTALGAVVLLGGVAAAGLVVATRQDDDDTDSEGADAVGVAAPSDAVAPEYLDTTNITPAEALPFSMSEIEPGITAPCSDSGALAGVATVSSGSGGLTDALRFKTVAGSFTTVEEAAQFASTIAAVDSCQYWHPEELETLHTVKSDGEQVELYYEVTDRKGETFGGVDTYVVDGKVVGVVACLVYDDDVGWSQCDQVVEIFTDKLHQVAAEHG